MRDSYYDTIYKLRHDHLNEKMFKKVVKDTYTAIFYKEIARIKEENYYFRYAIELFIDRQSTIDILMKFVKDHE